VGITRRGCDRREVRPRLGVGRSRRAGGPADRRRVHLDAADALRIRGPRPGGPLLRGYLRRRPQVRPRLDPSQRPTGVRRLPPHPERRPPWHGPVRPPPERGTNLRDDPLRGRGAAMVRAAPNTPEPIAGRLYRDARGVAGWAPAVTSS